MLTPQTARDLRRANRASVLRALYFDAPASRLQLSTRTGLSPATVGTVVNEFLDEGEVASTGQLDSDGGRPATLLKVRDDRAHAIGVDVGETGIRAELFDLGLGRLGAAQRPLPDVAPSPSEVVAAVAGVVEELRAGLSGGGDLLGIGVGVPGIVDGEDETVVHAPGLHWDGVPLQAVLQATLGAPVHVDNGAKTMGRAEAWFGAGRGVRDLVVALVGTGVGAAVVTNGVVYRGASSSAGEWGHTKIVLDGAPCRCGSRGCLEAYLGASAVINRHRSLMDDSPADSSQEEALQRLGRDAEAGEPAAVKALDETATYLAAGIGSLANLLNPSTVVLGGFVGLSLGPLLLPLVREALPRYALLPAAQRLELVLSRFGPDAVALGAATLPVERFLTSGGNIPRRASDLQVTFGPET